MRSGRASRLLRFAQGCCVVVVLAVAAGCSRRAPLVAIERAEGADEAMQEAMAAQSSGAFDQAYTLFKAITIAQPTNALAHLHLGIVLHDSLKDPCSALAHYQTYLFLRPDAEKRDMVEERIRQAKLQIGLEYQGGVATVNIADERKAWEEQTARLKDELAAARQAGESCRQDLEALRAEKAKLVRELDRLNKQVDTMLNSTRVSQPTPKDLAKLDLESDPSGQPTGPAGFADRTVKRTYSVRRGDTLWSIAQRFYGDASRNKDIRDANRKTLGGNDELTEGMLLVIPY